jgi:hypothetical protein
MSYVEEIDRLTAEVEAWHFVARYNFDRAEKAERQRDRARDLAAHLEEENAQVLDALQPLHEYMHGEMYTVMGHDGSLRAISQAVRIVLRDLELERG